MIRNSILFLCLIFPMLSYAENQRLSENYASYNFLFLDNKKNTHLVEVSLDGYNTFSQALRVSKYLKSRHLVVITNVQGIKKGNKWLYVVIVAEEVRKNKAEQLKFVLKQLNYTNIVINDLGIKKAPNKSLEILKNITKIEKELPVEDFLFEKVKKSSQGFTYVKKINDKDIEDLFSKVELAEESEEETIIMIADTEGENADKVNLAKLLLFDDVNELKPKEASKSKAVLSTDTKTGNAEYVIEWGGGLQVEQQVFSHSNSPVDHIQYIRGDAYVDLQFNSWWDARLGARIDGNYQHGSRSYNNTDLDYEDSYIRYRNDNYRITAGAQTIAWGVMDSFSPNDNLTTQDLSRGVLNDVGENYRSSVAIRAEVFLDESKLDFVYIPQFRAAKLSDKEQVWYPIDLYKGRILGFGDNDLLSLALKNSHVNDDFSQDSAYGVRYTTNVNSIDYGVNVQYTQLSTPYYRYDPLLASMARNPKIVGSINPTSIPEFTLYEEHPNNWIIGADMVFEWSDITWRMETAWFSDLPATNENIEYKTFNGLQWAGGFEFYPGDSDTRLNVQLTGKHIFNNEKIVDRNNSLNISGTLESELDNGMWKLSTRYSLGLDMRDIYISPEVSYLGWESIEVYSAFHFLSGNERSLGGFYKNNTLFNLGVRLEQ